MFGEATVRVTLDITVGVESLHHMLGYDDDEHMNADVEDDIYETLIPEISNLLSTPSMRRTFAIEETRIETLSTS